MESAGVPAHERRAFTRFDPRSAGGRLVVGTLAGLGAAFSLPTGTPLSVRLLVGWDGAAAVLLALMGHLLFVADAADTRCRAAAIDPGRRLSWFALALGSAFSLFASVGVLRHVGELAPRFTGWLTAACLFGVGLAWLLTHVVFALRYAHLFYRDDDEGVGGLGFPGKSPPDLFDFAYFSFTLGMTFQVSDVVIESQQIRRTALLHAVLSFAYNSAILALVINLVVARLG
jgi:uncharacterized membrane protein